MEKTPLTDPQCLLDEDSVHHRNLTGGPADAHKGDAYPHAETVGERHLWRLVRPRMRPAPGRHSDV